MSVAAERSERERKADGHGGKQNRTKDVHIGIADALLVKSIDDHRLDSAYNSNEPQSKGQASDHQLATRDLLVCWSVT